MTKREYYVAIMHKDIERDLRDMGARETWKNHYRAQRLAKKGIIEKPMKSEFGTFFGITIRNV